MAYPMDMRGMLAEVVFFLGLLDRSIYSILYNVYILFFCVLEIFLKKFKFFLFFPLLQINIFFMFLVYFDVLISKIIFKK
jgi:hypothetical protein